MDIECNRLQLPLQCNHDYNHIYTVYHTSLNECDHYSLSYVHSKDITTKEKYWILIDMVM